MLLLTKVVKLNLLDSRRKFLKLFGGTALVGLSPVQLACTPNYNKDALNKPLVIATWNNYKANEAAWEVLQNGGSALDAVEAGARIPEADPNDQSVGYGGLPDREGNVSLDACIMDHLGNAGSVCYLKNIKHPISVARKVMEETPHVILAGDGALAFALKQGFEKENLLSDQAKEKWLDWLKEKNYRPEGNRDQHDTIGILAIDQKGNLAGACTTSGMAYKMQGRVGDSPIIGAGMFVDNEVGAAAATGVGEKVLTTLGSFLVVELMRQGKSPQEACEEAVSRIHRKLKSEENIQVGYVALDKNGRFGAHSIQKGFEYTLFKPETKTKFAASFIQ